MKKLLLIMLVAIFGYNAHASTYLKTDTIKKDTVKINKQIRSLGASLLELKTELANVQNQIPIDSVKMENAISKSNDILAKSKKTASNAVGGDVSDAKKAEKEAKKAANASDDANDAKKQLEKDRKKIISLKKEIAKTQMKLDKLKSM